MEKNYNWDFTEIVCINVTQKRGNASLHFLRNPTSTWQLAPFIFQCGHITTYCVSTQLYSLDPLPQNNFDLGPARYADHTVG